MLPLRQSSSGCRQTDPANDGKMYQVVFEESALIRSRRGLSTLTGRSHSSSRQCVNMDSVRIA